jgi:hypothetical protein
VVGRKPASIRLRIQRGNCNFAATFLDVSAAGVAVKSEPQLNLNRTFVGSGSGDYLNLSLGMVREWVE